MTAPTKNCPYCGKEILAVAKKCKHCRRWLVEPPLSSNTGGSTEQETRISDSENTTKSETPIDEAQGTIESTKYNFEDSEIEGSNSVDFIIKIVISLAVFFIIVFLIINAISTDHEDYYNSNYNPKPSPEYRKPSSTNQQVHDSVETYSEPTGTNSPESLIIDIIEDDDVVISESTQNTSTSNYYEYDDYDNDTEPYDLHSNANVWK